MTTVNESQPYWTCGSLRRVGYNICTGNGECSGGSCLCNIGYVDSDCSISMLSFSAYVPWHWTLMAANGIAAVLVTWRLVLVLMSKIQRSGHRRWWKKWKGALDTQTGVLMLIWLGATGHTLFFIDPWTVDGVLNQAASLLTGYVAVTSGLLALGLVVRFFAGVHAKFDQATKKALKRLDVFCGIAGALFGIWALFFVVNTFYAFPQSTLNTMLTIYAGFGAVFIVVLNVALGYYALTTLRFVAKGTAGIEATPGQLAAQRLSQILRAIQVISATAITILIINYLIDPLGQNGSWTLAYLAMYRGVMLIGYLAILPVMGKVKSSVGPSAMTNRGSQINLGSQVGSTGGGMADDGQTLGSTGGTAAPGGHGSTLAIPSRSPRAAFGTARASGAWSNNMMLNARASGNFSSARSSQKWSPNNRGSMNFGQRTGGATYNSSRASGYAITLGPPPSMDQIRNGHEVVANGNGAASNTATSPSQHQPSNSAVGNAATTTSGAASSTTSPRIGVHDRPSSAEGRNHGRGVLNSRRAAAVSPPLRAQTTPSVDLRNISSPRTSPPPIQEEEPASAAIVITRPTTATTTATTNNHSRRGGDKEKGVEKLKSPALRTFDSIGTNSPNDSPAIKGSEEPALTVTPALNLAASAGDGTGSTKLARPSSDDGAITMIPTPPVGSSNGVGVLPLVSSKKSTPSSSNAQGNGSHRQANHSSEAGMTAIAEGTPPTTAHAGAAAAIASPASGSLSSVATPVGSRPPSNSLRVEPTAPVTVPRPLDESSPLLPRPGTTTNHGAIGTTTNNANNAS